MSKRLGYTKSTQGMNASSATSKWHNSRRNALTGARERLRHLLSSLPMDNVPSDQT
jgi:hypothetical protein